MSWKKMRLLTVCMHGKYLSAFYFNYWLTQICYHMPFFASGHVQNAPVARYLHAFPTHLLQNGIRIVSIGLRQNLGKRAPDICHRNVVDHRDKWKIRNAQGVFSRHQSATTLTPMSLSCLHWNKGPSPDDFSIVCWNVQKYLFIFLYIHNLNWI